MVGASEIYNEEDLRKLTKPFLLEIIRRQMDKWPLGKQNPDKTAVPALKSIILTGKYEKPGSSAGNTGSGYSSPLTPLERSTKSPEQQDQLTNISGDANTEERNLPMKLLLSDRRLGSADVKCSAEIVYLLASRPVAIGPDGENGNWEVGAGDLLTELQKTMAAIEGPAKIGISDFADADYVQYFAKMEGNELLQNVQTRPDRLTIPPSCRVQVFVDAISPKIGSPLSSGKPSRVEADDISKPSSSSQTKPEDVVPANPVGEWLKSQVVARPGWSEFHGSKHRMLQNAERVRFWAFAADFSREYFHTATPFSTRKIKKTDIKDALGIGTTSLADAENMTQIIRQYTEGPQASQAVIDRIKQTEQPPPGVDQLKGFLVKWEVNHPLRR